MMGATGLGAESAFNSFLFLVIFVVLYIVYRKRPREVERRRRWLAIAVTIIVAAILVIGKRLDNGSATIWTWKILAMITCLGAAIYAPMAYVIDFCLKLRLQRNIQLTRKMRIGIFGVIFLSNFLIYLALFPGIFGWDSNLQAWEFIHGQVNQHYSVLLGAVFGGILEMGKMVLGSYTAGMAVAMFLQMVLMSYIYARIVYFVAEETESKVALIGATMFFTLTLIMGMMTVYSTQDVIFGGIFALIFMELYRQAKNPKYWLNKINVAKFIILGFLLCACRNNGIYVLGVVFLIAIFIKAGRKRSLMIIAAPIVVSLLYTKIGFRALGIPDVDSTREILSVPSQQLARIYTLHEEELSDEEKMEIEKYYDRERFEQYRIYTMKADATKAALKLENVKENLGAYVGLWAKVGLKNPKGYIEAWLLNSLGTWYPNKKFYDPRANIPYIEFGMSNLRNEGGGRYADIVVERHSVLPGYEKLLETLFQKDRWQEVPFFANVVSMGSYFVLFIFVGGIIIYRKKWRMMLPLGLILGNYLILLLAPVAVFRYCYPMVMMAPIMVVMMLDTMKTERWQARKKFEVKRKEKV